jgi:GntR family carbon starvation induced transcriptional regulator
MTGREGRAEAVEAARSGAALSTVEAVYDVLKKDIISGALPPGQFLRIDRMSRTYGVGPTPLRETLQRLTAEAMVIAHGGRGFQVAPLVVAEFEDLNIARTAIELAALRLSIRHGDEAWEGRVVATGYILEKWDRVQSEGSGGPDAFDRWEHANSEFHAALLAGCPSMWLQRTLDGLRSKCERYRRAAMSSGGAGRHRQVAAEHKAMLRAVLARDAEESCRLLAAHYETTVALFRDFAARDDATD